jgi:hypothetical protein
MKINELYSLSNTNPRRTLGQRYGNIGAVQSAMPHFVLWARHNYPNKPPMTDAEILATFEAPAAHTDYVVKTDAPLGGTHVDLSNGIGSRATVEWGDGDWEFNIPTVFALGRYYGSGNGQASGSWGRTAGTGITLNLGAWISRVFPRRTPFMSDTYFMGGGYQESFHIKGFRFKGGRMNQPYTNAFESEGVLVWDAGESSLIELCYAEGFNTAGFTAIKGTSFSIRNCSSFSNGRFGVLLLGGNSNIFHVDLLSGDDNGEFLIASLPHGSMIGGGTIRATIVHHETGTRASRQMGIGWFDGRFTAIISAIHNQNFGVTVPAAFRVNGRTYASQLTVAGMNFSASDGNYTRIIDDIGQNRWWGTGNDIRHKPFSFVWQRELGGVVCTNYPVSRSSGANVPTTCHIVVADPLPGGGDCPEPVPCPDCPDCPEPVPCPECPEPTPCPDPVPCPDCPDCPDQPAPDPDPEPEPEPMGRWECRWVNTGARCGLWNLQRRQRYECECVGGPCAEPAPTQPDRCVW